MKRRGFFGLMAGAAAAGPSMAKQAIAGMESLSIGTALSGAGMIKGAESYATAGYAVPVDDRFDPVKWATDQLSDFLGKSAEDLLRERLETHVGALDPDLSIMRALSLDSKIRMQRDRNFQRNRAHQLGYLRRDLAQTLKRLAS